MCHAFHASIASRLIWKSSSTRKRNSSEVRIHIWFHLNISRLTPFVPFELLWYLVKLTRVKPSLFPKTKLESCPGAPDQVRQTRLDQWMEIVQLNLEIRNEQEVPRTRNPQKQKAMPTFPVTFEMVHLSWHSPAAFKPEQNVPEVVTSAVNQAMSFCETFQGWRCGEHLRTIQGWKLLRSSRYIPSFILSRVF